MSELVYLAETEDDTDRLGHAIARQLLPGDVVALNGELGAGKTRLVRGIVTSLSDDDQLVNSPTFVIIQQYSGSLPVYHIDAYRLTDEDEFLALGVDEILPGDGVCLIEWADRIAGALPTDHLRIDILPTGMTARQFTLSASGDRSTAIVRQLRM